MAEQQQPNIKHDWYQTESAVVITVLIKNVKQENLAVNCMEKSVTVEASTEEIPKTKLTYNLLHKVVPEACTTKITPSKIEVKLKKLEGLRWEKLEGEVKENIKVIKQTAPVITDGPLAYPTSKIGKDWNAIEKDIKKQEQEETPEGEEALAKMFQEIYGKGNDDVRKAMNKSFLESGGTVLSTNWKEIGKQTVAVQPPDGAEFKKWDD